MSQSATTSLARPVPPRAHRDLDDPRDLVAVDSFLGLAYFLAYLTVSISALRRDDERRIEVFADDLSWGAGIFFIGYFLFEVPSNLALEKFGASRWIARIM